MDARYALTPTTAVYATLLPDFATIEADQEQIKRVVVNLIDNAAEAMIEAPVRQLFVRTSQPGPETVELAVIDTGCGISRIHLHRHMEAALTAVKSG